MRPQPFRHAAPPIAAFVAIAAAAFTLVRLAPGAR